MKLTGEKIKLRALEPADIDVLYQWENDTSIWKLSNTSSPFSKYTLEQYINTAHLDIYTTKQLRLMICDKKDMVIGCIDLFDFDPNNQRAGVGILIANKENRKKGYADEALKLLKGYCFEVLNLYQLYCNITSDNKASLKLFQNHGFSITGNKRKWIREGRKFKDENLLQLINS